MKKVFRIRFFRSQSDNRKSKIQNRKWVGIVGRVLTFAMCGAVAEAQQVKKLPRVGFLQPGIFPQLIEKNSGKVCANSVT
jgi:hypothetical protein